MHQSNPILRREFLSLTALSLGGALTAKAAKTISPQAVSLKDAHLGSLEIDLRIMNQYQQQSQDTMDFYTACREAMAGDSPEKNVPAICKKYGRRKLGGPMLGNLSPTSISVWIHLAVKDKVTVIVKAIHSDTSHTFHSTISSDILTIDCEGLDQASEYSYKVFDSKGNDLGSGKFTTPPEELTREPMRLAFGADFHKVGLYRPELMQYVADRGNLAMMLIGDSAVDGRKANYPLINADYLLRNLAHPWQNLTSNVPVSATWDDHDYWGNDTFGKFTKSKKTIDVSGLRSMWKRQWNNPERETPRNGIYFQKRMGPVHYIALDTRSCRVNDARGEPNSFLGSEQMDWLKSQIEKSDSDVIIISGGTMWTDYISKGKDSWGTWDTQGRETIFKWLDAKENTQVILLSGDRHGARAFKIIRPTGRVFHELEIGTLGGVPGPGAYGDDRSSQLFGYPGRTWAFGELAMHKANKKLSITFCLIDENGKELEKLQLG